MKLDTTTGLLIVLHLYINIYIYIPFFNKYKILLTVNIHKLETDKGLHKTYFYYLLSPS